jgi:predicted phage-related endonuclease
MIQHHLENVADSAEKLYKDFATMKLADKVDTAARLQSVAKVLDAIDKETKDAIKKKKKPNEDEWSVLGHSFKAVAKVISSERLDQKLVKENYPEVARECTVTTESERISFKVR